MDLELGPSDRLLDLPISVQLVFEWEFQIPLLSLLDHGSLREGVCSLVGGRLSGRGRGRRRCRRGLGQRRSPGNVSMNIYSGTLGVSASKY